MNFVWLQSGSSPCRIDTRSLSQATMIGASFESRKKPLRNWGMGSRTFRMVKSRSKVCGFGAAHGNHIQELGIQLASR